MNNNQVDIYGVTEKNNRPIVSSRRVAEVFSKQHKDVLESVRKITASTSGLSEKFRQRNFTPSSYRNEQNKRQPEVLLTRDGFTILAMGFTGKKAIQFKEAYINRFNQMEQFIQNLQEAKMEFPDFTYAVMLAHDEPKHYHFSNEINMINRIAIGLTASEFKQSHGLDKSIKSIRPYLTLAEIKNIKTLQRADIGLLVSIKDFQERKRLLTSYHNQKSEIATRRKEA